MISAGRALNKLLAVLWMHGVDVVDEGMRKTTDMTNPRKHTPTPCARATYRTPLPAPTQPMLPTQDSTHLFVMQCAQPVTSARTALPTLPTLPRTPAQHMHHHSAYCMYIDHHSHIIKFWTMPVRVCATEIEIAN